MRTTAVTSPPPPPNSYYVEIRTPTVFAVMYRGPKGGRRYIAAYRSHPTAIHVADTLNDNRRWQTA